LNNTNFINFYENISPGLKFYVEKPTDTHTNTHTETGTMTFSRA